MHSVTQANRNTQLAREGFGEAAGAGGGRWGVAGARPGRSRPDRRTRARGRVSLACAALCCVGYSAHAQVRRSLRQKVHGCGLCVHSDGRDWDIASRCEASNIVWRSIGGSQRGGPTPCASVHPAPMFSKMPISRVPRCCGSSKSASLHEARRLKAPVLVQIQDTWTFTM